MNGEAPTTENVSNEAQVRFVLHVEINASKIPRLYVLRKLNKY